MNLQRVHPYGIVEDDGYVYNAVATKMRHQNNCHHPGKVHDQTTSRRRRPGTDFFLIIIDDGTAISVMMIVIIIIVAVPAVAVAIFVHHGWRKICRISWRKHKMKVVKMAEEGEVRFDYAADQTIHDSEGWND